jgi:hypothetical protein|tara:strand:- start:1143 stop:1262 length:120 start_codon:yes stop_codon:yes gene_type:complete
MPPIKSIKELKKKEQNKLKAKPKKCLDDGKNLKLKRGGC